MVLHPLSSILFLRVFVKPLRAFVILLALLGVTGCALNFNTRALGVPVSMAEPLAAGVAGDTFNVTVRAVHAFWGLGVVKDANLQHALAGQLGTGASVHNLAIRTRKRWTDVLASLITLGFVQTTSVTFTGTVARATP